MLFRQALFCIISTGNRNKSPQNIVHNEELSSEQLFNDQSENPTQTDKSLTVKIIGQALPLELFRKNLIKQKFAPGWLSPLFSLFKKCIFVAPKTTMVIGAIAQ